MKHGQQLTVEVARRDLAEISREVCAAEETYKVKRTEAAFAAVEELRRKHARFTLHLQAAEDEAARIENARRAAEETARLARVEHLKGQLKPIVDPDLRHLAARATSLAAKLFERLEANIDAELRIRTELATLGEGELPTWPKSKLLLEASATADLRRAINAAHVAEGRTPKTLVLEAQLYDWRGAVPPEPTEAELREARAAIGAPAV